MIKYRKRRNEGRKVKECERWELEYEEKTVIESDKQGKERKRIKQEKGEGWSNWSVKKRNKEENKRRGKKMSALES